MARDLSSNNIKGLEQLIDEAGASQQTSPPDIIHRMRTNPTYVRESRINFINDTPDIILGLLEEFKFLEAANRYLSANTVYKCQKNYFTTLHLEMLESCKEQISHHSRKMLSSSSSLSLGAYSDALSAVAVLDKLYSFQVLQLFLDAKHQLISEYLRLCTPLLDDVISLCSQVSIIIQVTLAQVGHLFLHLSSSSTDIPLFYNTVLVSHTHLFAELPFHAAEFLLWKSQRTKLNSGLKPLTNIYLRTILSPWWRQCTYDIISGMHHKNLFDVFQNFQQIIEAENNITQQLRLGSLEWKTTCDLVLKVDIDLWVEIFEYPLIERMEEIFNLQFDDMQQSFKWKDSESTAEQIDYLEYSSKLLQIKLLSKSQLIQLEEEFFRSCLNSYLGADVCRIINELDSHFERILSDLLMLLQSPYAFLRLEGLALCLQHKCYSFMTTMLYELHTELKHLFAAVRKWNKEGDHVIPSIMIQRSLFIGRLLFALQKHSKLVPVILGSPKSWLNNPMAEISDSSALYGAHDSSNPLLETLYEETQGLCIRAHDLWISRVSEQLSAILSRNLMEVESLSAIALLGGWEETVVEQQSAESPLEMRSLPSRPSIHITSFLLDAIEEIHRVGGHFLDSIILQNFASTLLDKVTSIYSNCLSSEGDFVTRVSKRGALQIILDLEFSAAILLGGDAIGSEDVSGSPKVKKGQTKKAVSREPINSLISDLAQGLDPLTYEPCVRRAADLSRAFRCLFFGQAVKLDTSSGCSTTCSNYLSRSAPVLSAKGASWQQMKRSNSIIGFGSRVIGFETN